MSAVLTAAWRVNPQARSWERAAVASRGPRGIRLTGMSDIVSTPPGRSTREHSAKKAAREEKWNAASTQITPSNEPERNGIRVASPLTGSAPASSSRRRPRRSCESVMFKAVRERTSATPEITGSCSASTLPTSRTSRPVGRSAASRSTSRRTATGASSRSLPSPSHRPRFSQPGASAKKKSSPIESYTVAAGLRPYRSIARPCLRLSRVQPGDIAANPSGVQPFVEPAVGSDG